ncbi:PDC sensor domain-containing protein [Alcanivorax sp. S6407]|uniref:PDC sensor domain-containing protein n=1 Tax=Alcanivorax sp. S6407 TaxID=2926424 RepID=UPI001FF53257|nr:PDC sensor domain-containing protein [Alcanivorax sp. S6407]MCK0153756.1 PDC sensor domain-containing protein [Alcanivorax sp. S6407]
MKWIRTAVLALCMCGSAQADDASNELVNFGRTQAAHIAARADVIAQVEIQNQISAMLSEDDIALLDSRWQQEFGSSDSPLIHRLTNNPLSDALRTMQLSSNELITEIIIMDNRGLNVAQSSITSDYWQGDEAKWQQTFQLGPGAEHVGEMKQDDSTGSFQIQVSRTITDRNGQAIGAVTVGVAPVQFD